MHVRVTRGGVAVALAMAVIVIGGVTVLALWISGVFNSETSSAATTQNTSAVQVTCDNANRAAGNCGDVIAAEPDRSGYFQSLGDHGVQVVSASWSDSLLQYGHLACILLDTGESAVDVAMNLPDMPAPDSQLLPLSHHEAGVVVGAAGAHLCPDHAQEIAAYGGSF